MLGLGNSLTHSSVTKEITPPFSYSKRIIESSDGWYLSGVSGSSTIDYNETAPDSTTGWMKITFDQDQPDFWALINNTILAQRAEQNASVVIKYKVYLHDASTWGNDGEDDDDVIAWTTFLAGGTDNTDVTPSTSTSITHTIPKTFSASSQIQLRNQVISENIDLPLASAELYVKDIEIDVTYS